MGADLLKRQLRVALRWPDEKNERSKTLIRSKIGDYLSRAEALKVYLANADEQRARKAVGANGIANGGIGAGGKK